MRSDTHFSNLVAKAVEEYNSFHDKELNTIVTQMASTFERRKKAYENLMSNQRMSGSVDFSRLAHYKTSEDIFKRLTLIPKGKNHAIYILLDWSSSMTSIAKEVVKQAAIISMFCKRINIPFVVSFFTTSGNSGGSSNTDEVSNRNLKLITVCDSTMSPKTIRKNFGEMYASKNDQVCEFARHTHLAPEFHAWNNQYQMHYTPLGIAMGEILPTVNAFRTQGDYETVSLYCITDGEDSEGLTDRNGYSCEEVINPFTNKKYVVKENGGVVSVMCDMYRDLGMAVHNIFLTSNVKDCKQFGTTDKRGNVCTSLPVNDFFMANMYFPFQDLGGYNTLIAVNPSLFSITKDINIVDKVSQEDIASTFNTLMTNKKKYNKIADIIVDAVTDCYKTKKV